MALTVLSLSAWAGEPQLKELTLEELLDVSIVSASNTAEKLSDAPATVIVITKAEMLQRGYTDLSEILDDLPGMDMARPYGDTYLKNYWRGYRNTIGDPFLLMVDGIVLNHLYFATADVLVTIPLSNVERVEVVYGPASSVYGANAFMGVLNVITRRDLASSGSHVTAALSAGAYGTRIADANAFYKKDDLRISVTARLENGELDTSRTDAYEYTKAMYSADRRLWGGFVDNPNVGGDFVSHRRFRGLDARAFLSTFELGVRYYETSSGNGLAYAADRVQPNAVWSRPDFDAFLRDRRTVGALSFTTLVRYRTSDVGSGSNFVESLTGTRNGQPVQLAQMSYWQALNSSWSVFEDVELRATSDLSFTAGLKYEQKDLQKAYDLDYGPSVPVDELDASTYPYPHPSFPAPVTQNRITTEDVGVYLQAKYRFDEHHQLNVGLRNDHNSVYGSAATIRAGYVGHFGPWSAKALYGEAFQEPNPRLLYGGWTGSGSDPRLLPEESRTIEVSGSYQTKRLSALLSFYDVRNDRTIINTASGAANLGERRVDGFDVHVQALLETPFLKQLRVWAYYSRLLSAREKRLDGQGAEIPSGRIPDLSNDKVYLGVTAVVNDHLSVTLRGRATGRRPTVETNPIREAPGAATFDVSAVGTDLFVKGLGITLKVTNLLDQGVFHPGVRDASAGDTPGAFDATGAWHGSGGYFNSLLPQPGRAALVSAQLSF